ncbi:MAG: transposase [Terasakiella sp.]|uniref:transposase n=1 Tax=unclassified Terasakiella TaxID=2614952 RepID=UPI003AFFEC62
MARLARVTIPNLPHHITQRGNRRQQTFFCDADYELYLDLLAEWCLFYGVEIWAYCLMPNHTHVIAVPKTEVALGRAMAETHRRYTRHINFEKKWKGHLWQSRFASFPMDKAYLMNCARYVELNPVRARLCKYPEEWRWSSARAHMCAEDDGLVRVAPLLQHVESWQRFLADDLSQKDHLKLQQHERTGRPLGDDNFVQNLEEQLGRPLLPKKPGPKPRDR